MTVGGKRESNICMTEEIRQREKSRRKIIRLSQKDSMSQENNWISQRSLQEGVKVMEIFGCRWEEKNKMDHPFIFWVNLMTLEWMTSETPALTDFSEGNSGALCGGGVWEPWTCCHSLWHLQSYHYCRRPTHNTGKSLCQVSFHPWWCLKCQMMSQQICLTPFLKKATVLEILQAQGNWSKRKSNFISRDQL